LTPVVIPQLHGPERGLEALDPVSFAYVPLLLGVSLALICAMCLMAGSPLVANRYNATLFAAPVVIAAIIGVAVWNNPTVDRFVYAKQLLLMRGSAAPWDSEYFGRDPLFSVYLWAVGRLAGTSAAVFFGATALILVCAYLATCWMLRMQSWAIAGAIVTLIFSGYFAAYSGIAVRQGLALAAILVAIGLVVLKGRLAPPAILFLITAGLLHWSAAIFAGCFAVIAVLKPSLKVLLGGWVVCLALGLSGIAENIVSRFGLSMVDVYTSNNAYVSYGRTGLRLDFVALSALLALMSYVVTTRWPTSQGLWLSSTFLVFNSLYLILGYVAFSDRLAVYSLVLVPLSAWYALSVVQRTRGVALPVAALLSATMLLGVQAGQWQMVSAWW
jgi:hypothetical protein